MKALDAWDFSKSSIELSDTLRLLWSAWNIDPIKAAVFRAILSVQARLGGGWPFGFEIYGELSHRVVRFPFIGSGGSTLLNKFQLNIDVTRVQDLFSFLYRNPDTWTTLVSNVQEENH
jgi:hypothetical protein